MFRAVLRIVNIQKKEEERPALLLLGYGFFMGVFLATYRVVVETLFLDTQVEYLKEAFFVSGILGVLGTWLYTILQKRISFSKVAVVNLVVVFAFIAAIYLNISGAASQLFIFILYIMLFPVTSIMLLSFWGLFGRIFDLRQSKRIIGSIDAGQLIATILALISVPFFIEYVGEVIDLLAISASSILFCLVFIFFINKQIRFNVEGTSDTGSDVYRFGRFFRNKYAILLSVFIGISIICVTFVDYTFLKITEQQYPDEVSLAKFLSYMYLSIMIFTLIMQTFVNDKLIASYGLKTALTILPVVLGLFTIASIISGNLFGFVSTSANFIWFFLFIGLSKFFSNSLREALENPTFKIFFMPLNINIRFDIQAKVEGVINESARLIAGGLILVLGLISYFELIHYSYFLLAIVIGYFFVTGKLYNEYRNNVRKKLESHEEEDVIDTEVTDTELVLNNLKGIMDPGTSMFTLKVIQKLDREKFYNFLPELINSKSKILKKFSLLKLNDIRNIHTDSNPKKIKIVEDTQKSKEDIGQWLSKLLHADRDISLIEEVSRLCRSEVIEDRIEAINRIVGDPEDEVIPYLVELINDYNFTVQSTAIAAIGKLKRPDLYPFLIDKLSNATFGDLASAALIEIGDDVIQYLEIIFQKTDQDPQTQMRIIKIYERIGSERAKELLWSKIDYPDKKVVSQILSALANIGFRAEGYQAVRIKYVIESDINDIIWNLHALDKIPNTEIGVMIHDALYEENKNHHHHIYMLLSMIFDQYSIKLIKSNLESATSEGITYALELLDVLLTEDLKDRVIPLFDDIPNQDKIKKLQVFYPHILGDFKDVIKQIINKEFNQINRWSKTLAIYWVGVNRESKMLYELIANLFNPDPLIRDTAAWSLHKIGPELYEEHSARIGKDRKYDLDAMILAESRFSQIEFIKPLSIQKAFFLIELGIFRSMPSSFVISILDITEELYLRKDQKLKINEESNHYFYIVYDGVVNIVQKGVVINSLYNGDYLGELLIEEIAENDITLHPLKNTLILRIYKEKFYELLGSDHELSLAFLRFLTAPPTSDLSKTA